jgi:hypothetical protein
MNYSLGNMLSRGGALNPDGLALDLQFAADKTLTARKGPTPTFTRASTATFVGSNGLIQSAAINTPRFDHNPVTLACKGLLIEESRTNIITYSEDMSVANGWSEDSNRILWVNNATTSPNGNTTAEKITELASAGVSRKISVKNVSVVSGTTYTLSVYAKAAERSFLQITASANFTSAYQNFDLSNGTIGSGTATSSAITAMGNGWYRCSIVAQASATASGTITVGIVPASTSTLFTAYLGADNHGIFLWGAQLEAGSFPTSYIPTTTAALTRSADVCSITGSDFTGFWNPSEGTLFASGVTRGYPVMASSGANSNQIAIFRNPSPLYMRFDVASGGAYTAQIISATIADGSFNKTAGSYATNDARAAFNGALGTADITVTVPSNLTTLNIGSQSLGSAPHNGHIAAIRYYKKRLPDAKLQSLTL